MPRRRWRSVLAAGLRSVARALEPPERRDPRQPAANTGTLNLEGAPEHWVRRVQAAGAAGFPVGRGVRMNRADGHDATPPSRPRHVPRAARDGSPQSPPIPVRPSRATSRTDPAADAAWTGEAGKGADGRRPDPETTAIGSGRPARLFVGGRRDSPTGRSQQPSRPVEQVATPGRGDRRRAATERPAAAENGDATEPPLAVAATPTVSSAAVDDRPGAERASARIDAPRARVTRVAGQHSDTGAVPRTAPATTPRGRGLGLPRGPGEPTPHAVQSSVALAHPRTAIDGPPPSQTRAWPPAEAVPPDPPVTSPWPTLPPTTVAASAAGADVVRGLARAERLDHEQRTV